MKGLSMFSWTKVEDEQDKHDDVLRNEKDISSLETMSAEMTSLKGMLLSKEYEVQGLKDMVAQKDEEIKRLKDALSERDLKVYFLRADVDSAWKKFDTSLSITSPERSENEIKHEKERGEEEIRGMARKEDEIRIQPIFHPLPSSPFAGPPRHSYLSIAESNLVGAQNSRGGQKHCEIRSRPNFRRLPATALRGPPRHSHLSKAESDLVGAQCSRGAKKQDEIRSQPNFRRLPATTLPAPRRHSQLSKAESDLVGAPKQHNAPEGSVDQIPGYGKTRR